MPSIRWFLLLAAVSSMLLAADDTPPGVEALLKRFDKNGDGKVTREEAGDPAWFNRVDRNGDGVLTKAELAILVRLRGAVGSLPGKPDEAPSAPESPRQGPKILRAAEQGVGRMMPDASFIDIHGKRGKLSGFKSGKALVVAFTTTSCPLTKKFAPTLATLEKEFASRGVKFLYVNPTASDSTADIKTLIKEQSFQGPYVHDKDGALTGAFGAGSTTEVFVLDAARTLVFRGAVDDQYGLAYSLDAPRHRYLNDALVAVLDGKAPIVAATDAPGCALEVKPSPKLARDVTYHNSISRIVQNNCLECHRSGGVAPFSLETYSDVKSHAAMIRMQVERGAMPPWFAAPAKDNGHSLWSNDRSLTARDKSDLLAWLVSDKPAGNPADAPLARVFPSGWQIGEPDLVVELPHPVQVKATGVMPYQLLTAETKLTEDKWVQAYEVQPTAREVVHHVIVRVNEKGAKISSADEGEAQNGREGYFAIYVPGNSHTVFPEGFARKIPAGATVSFQIHYTPNGKAATDQMKLGIVFAKEPPRRTIHVAGVANATFSIPPGDPNHLVTAKITLPFDATVTGFLPHMHLRGKAARYEATLPDGTKKLLLDVPRYDFNWQLLYKLAEPAALPRGTTLTFSAWYDNSAGNPANPDPSKAIRWGQQTFDEMALGYVEYFVR